MTGWKKYASVAFICLLVLGLMLYGDLGTQFDQGGRGIEFGTASVSNKIDNTVVQMGSGQVGEIVNLFSQTGVPAVVDITAQQRKDPEHEDLIRSYLYYQHCYEVEHYPAAPKRIEEMMDNNVWRHQQRLVDHKDPERDALRIKRAGEMGSTVRGLETFIRNFVAGSSKQAQFVMSLRQGNRSEMALLYQISREKARIRYMEFPATDYLDIARLKVAGMKPELQARYDADKVKPRSPQGATGESMYRSLKLQFDMFWVEQDSFMAEEKAKMQFNQVMAEYTKQKDDFEKNHLPSLLTLKKAHLTFEAYTTDAGKKLTLDPKWKELTDDQFLPPEDVVLDYIKVQMVKRTILGRAQTTMDAFGKKYNEAFIAAPLDQRADFAANFLARLKQADAAAFDKQFKNVQYLRTALDEYKAYDQAHQEKITPATKTPAYLKTFFDHVNKGELGDFQNKLSAPLNYNITYENNASLITAQPGGAIAFTIHAVENLDPAQSVMPFEDPAAQALLTERLARTEAPKLAEAAAKDMFAAWNADPAKISTDPKLVQEYTSINPTRDDMPRLSQEEMRQERIVDMILTGPVDPKTGAPVGDAPVGTGKLVGPSEIPVSTLAALGSDFGSDSNLRKAYVIGFVAQFHQVEDPFRKVTEDTGWRNSSDFYSSQMSTYVLPWKMHSQSVADAFVVTLVKPKTAN